MEKIATPNHLTREQAFALVDAVAEREEMAITASAFEKEKDCWVFEAICDSEPNIEQFNDLVSEVLKGRVNFSIEQVDSEIDYISKSLKDLQPISAGGFYIYGSHNKDELPNDQIAIKIDAAQAFGTGHHETTTSCLEAINIVLEQEIPENSLDIGTGTGVLAIAIAKCTNNFVFASDNDPIAVKIAQENAKINGVEEKMLCFKAEGFEHQIIKDNAPFDLITANILAQPLIDMASDMSQTTMANGKIILSGILDTQAAKLITAYENVGFMLVERLIKNEWTTVIFTKQDR